MPNKIIKKTKIKKKAKAKAKGKSIEETYQKKSLYEHIFTDPDTYAGSMDLTEAPIWVYNKKEERMEKKNVKYIPVLYKIFDEIIVNATDQCSRLLTKESKGEQVDNHVSMIKVSIDQKTGEIEVYNNGDGIDVAMHKEHNMYVPELIFGHLLTSANYDKSEEKTTGGKNGYGAKLTNIFSSSFTIETVDCRRKLKFKQTYSRNMLDKTKPKITSCRTKPYTKITFTPCFKRFGIKGLSDDIVAMMERRVYDATATTPKGVSVYLNGEKIKTKAFEDYVNLYVGKKTETKRIYESPNERWEIVVTASPDDKMEHVSFVNGIYTFRGGKHVDYIVNQIARKIVKRVKGEAGKRAIKKYSGVKAAHIKDNMFVFIRSTIVNPSFDTQTKEFMTTLVSKFGSKCELSDKFIEDLIKKTAIMERADRLSSYKMQKDVSKTDGKRRGRVYGIPKLEDAIWAGSAKSEQCTLIITEGDSAKSVGVIGRSILGENRIGVFPLKGKLKNVSDATSAQILKCVEITNLKKILGLQEYETGTNKPKVYKDVKSLRYGHVVILTDQDQDGFHIKGLFMNFIYAKWPSLLKIDGFIKSMITPIVKLTKGKQKISFFTLGDYEKWKEENTLKGWTVKYYKGLGTSTEKESREYFKNYDNQEVTYYRKDKKCDESIDMAFNKKKANKRKKWLKDYNIQDTIDAKERNVSFQDFINKELIHYSNASNIRAIPSICDGLKPSLRKILFGVFKRNLTKQIKVSQLGGFISEHAAYHHGEKSLEGAIIGMAQEFVGSNNINLLVPHGQFGTRLLGGKDAASARYIFTCMSKLTSILFNKHDAPLYKYLDDDGDSIEPEWYLPCLPLILVNGTTGIGTGYSTKIPSHNPLDIVANLRILLQSDASSGDEVKLTKMNPWFRGFTGTIEKKGRNCYTKGRYTIKNGNTIEITELPVGVWTDVYKERLESMMIDSEGKAKVKCVKSYKNMSTTKKVKITVECDKNKLAKLLEKPSEFEKAFQLSESANCGTTNMHLWDRNFKLKKYKNTEEILREYYDIRLEYYDKRRTHLLKKLKHELMIIDNKVRFIEYVIEGKLVVFRRPEEDIVKDMEEMKFDKISMKEEQEPSYDYLIGMQIRRLTKQKIEELKKQQITKIKELKDLENKTPKQLWLDDLDEFEIEYKKVMEEWTKEQENGESNDEKKSKKKGVSNKKRKIVVKRKKN